MSLNSLDRGRFAAGQLLFITLTYGAEFPKNPKGWRNHLTSFRERLERRYGRQPAFWKLEPQVRGAPHWHVLLLMGSPAHEGLKTFRGWVRIAWTQVRGNGKVDHLNGSRVDQARQWRDVDQILRYVGKPCAAFVDRETGELLPVGRFWGVWNRRALPVEWRLTELPEPAFFQVARALRRYLRWGARRSTSFSAFVPSPVVERLIAWAQGHPVVRVSCGLPGSARPPPSSITETQSLEWELARKQMDRSTLTLDNSIHDPKPETLWLGELTWDQVRDAATNPGAGPLDPLSMQIRELFAGLRCHEAVNRRLFALFCMAAAACAARHTDKLDLGEGQEHRWGACISVLFDMVHWGYPEAGDARDLEYLQSVFDASP